MANRVYQRMHEVIKFRRNGNECPFCGREMIEQSFRDEHGGYVCHAGDDLKGYWCQGYWRVER